MGTLNTTMVSSSSSVPPSALPDEAETAINAKPNASDVNGGGGMMISTKQSREPSTSPIHHNHSPTSSSGSSGSSSSTPTPTATTAGGVVPPKRRSPPPALRSSSPQQLRKSPDAGVRRNASAGSGTASYSGLIAVPEEGVMSMDFAGSSASASTSTATARNHGTAFAVPDESQGPRQSPPRYLGGLDLSGDDPYDSEDEDLEEWLIDEELARGGLYRGSYQRILTFYTLTPLTTLIAFGLLSLVPVYLRAHAYHHLPPNPSPPRPPSQSPGDVSTSPGYVYTSYLPYPLPELITGMAIWSLGYLSRQGLAFLGGLLSSEDDDDDDDDDDEPSAAGVFQTPIPRNSRRRLTFGITSRALRHFLSISRNAVIGSTTILLQSVLSIFLQLVSIVLLGVTLPPPPAPLPPLPSPSPEPSFAAPGPRLSPYTTAFARIWYIALGWAAIEAILGIAQGYANLALYRDVVVSVRRVVSPGIAGADTASAIGNTQTGLIGLTQTRGKGAVEEVVHGRSRSGTTASVDSLDSLPRGTLDERQPLLGGRNSVAFRQEPVRAGQALPVIQIPGAKRQYTTGSSKAIEMEVEHDLEELVALKKREELEEMYGMPFIYIPSFISCLHRLNALLFTVGSFLLAGAGYLRLSTPPPSSIPSPSPPLRAIFQLASLASRAVFHPSTPTVLTNTAPRAVIFFLLPTLMTFLLSILHSPHSPRVLPWIGIHSFVFVSLMVSLGLFFSGLGVWGAVV